MYNPMRRERLKFLYENDPNFSNAKAAEELGVEEATVRMWIKPSYNVGDKRQNANMNVKRLRCQQKKRLTNSHEQNRQQKELLKKKLSLS
uniref:Transposase n=1 Tax=Ditylenchus dipsaci TaxID=166011 RepID=A0A915EAD1_9BILA